MQGEQDKKNSKIKTNHKVWSDPFHFLAFGFGSGLAPFAPGTFGTLAAIPVYLLLVLNLSTTLYVLATLLIVIVGIPICQRVSDDLKVHDFSGIVWDEIAGFLITMLFLPCSWQYIVLGFILFRCFDIFKPWPISWLDQYVHGGLGIMLDDVVAGIFSWLILFVAYQQAWFAF